MALTAVKNLQVTGSTGRTYDVTIYTSGEAHCTCPAWKFGKTPAAQRTCKHTRALPTMPRFTAA